MSATIVAPDTSVQTSLFVDGSFPRRKLFVLLFSVVSGLFVAYAWSAQTADDKIGINTANTLLGHNATSTPIAGIGSGILFAFVTGFAGSFTACNVACFGAVGPLVGSATTQREKLAATLKPIGWMAVGLVPVSAAYGALVGIVGTRMPQFSTKATKGLSPRSIQSMIAFGTIGLIMVILGLAALGIIADPLAALSRRWKNAPLILMGAMIGGFLIGRPYPLFHAMFRSAALHHNPFYGAAAFALQSVGNIIVMAVLFLILAYGLGGRIQRWLTAKPGRTAIVTSVAFIAAGIFTMTYWDVKVLARSGYGWFPTAPWH